MCVISKENIKKYAPDFLCATAISLLVGIVCGLVGTLFVKSISAVTLLRENNGWILYLLPIFGLILTFIYNKLNLLYSEQKNIFLLISEFNPLVFPITAKLYISSIL